MGYYNNVYVVFGNGHEGMDDYRTAGQTLPDGSVPIAIINACEKTYTEIINTETPEKVMRYMVNRIKNDDISDEMKKEIIDEFLEIPWTSWNFINVQR